jgi:hypothetical protein
LLPQDREASIECTNFAYQTFASLSQKQNRNPRMDLRPLQEMAPCPSVKGCRADTIGLGDGWGRRHEMKPWIDTPTFLLEDR